MTIPQVLLLENNTTTVLEKGLKDAQFNVFKTDYSATFIALAKEIKPDIVVINSDFPSKKLLNDLLTLNQQSAVPVILFTQDNHTDTLKQAMQAGVAAYILNNPDPHRLNNIITVAIARFKHQQTIKNALEEACAKLEDRKQIDRAKAILIKTQHFSEDQAYHALRKLAMDRNITLGEMAKNVIAMAELLK